MVKWLANIFDSTDKEIGRLRRIVIQANDEIVAVLEQQRECVGALRDEVFETLRDAGVQWQSAQAGEMASVAAEARRLAGQADTLRSVIERGEQTSRDLSVLLADSKQLSAMNTDKMQRPAAERRELEEEIEQLVDELGEQLAALMEAKPGLRDAIF